MEFAQINFIQSLRLFGNDLSEAFNVISWDEEKTWFFCEMDRVLLDCLT